MSGKVGDDTVVLRRGRELIIYDATRLGSGGALEKLLSEDGEVLQGGRGVSVRIRCSSGDVIRRGYRRGGWMVFLGDRHLRTGWSQSRPIREWRLLQALVREGLPVPRPLVARVSPWGIWYRGDIWMAAVPGVPLPEASQRTGGAGTGAAALILGRVLRRLHDAGIDHPDLHVGNILVQDRGLGEDDYTILDFDRARRRRSGRWCRRNLARLHRSLHRLALEGRMQEDWWKALLAGYEGGQGRR